MCESDEYIHCRLGHADLSIHVTVCHGRKSNLGMSYMILLKIMLATLTFPKHVVAMGDGEVLAMFSKHEGCMESNEMEVVAILEVLRIFALSFNSELEVESDSMNVISWVPSSCMPLCRFQSYFNEIKELFSKISLKFLLLDFQGFHSGNRSDLIRLGSP